ncbi:hypothetical protein PTKIN_Ptkin17bG0134400 [Pterospermum kingtungense]
MGNCLTSNNKIQAENDQDEAIKETGKVITGLEGAAEVADGVMTKKKKKQKKKIVRFKLDEENYVDGGKQGETKNGVVRIRVVVSQEELRQILSSRKDLKQSSMEELVRVMKLRGTRVSEDGFHGAWRPALESIPEEH